MLGKSHIGAVVFFVRDLEKTRHFYGDILGFETTLAEGHDGGYLIAQAGDVTLVFFKGNEKPGRSPIVVFTADHDDIHSLVDRLTEKGVEIVAPVQEAPSGGLTADFADPDGHVLSLYTANQ
ncbi:MAG TPA: VOC family protein [Gammaproteobacteria bacterium]